MRDDMNRRGLLKAGAALAGASALGGCADIAKTPIYNPRLAPVRATPDRIFDITVCLRPFRAQGPRLDVETIRNTMIVHNYGHGGSGWSLSWGSGTIAVQKAMANSPREIAVIGCGALGLTSAILAQRAGAKVTIYAREELPQTRSARATGSWTPDSRIALTNSVSPDFPALWEQMARTSFKTYRSYLGLPGDPVEWRDHYFVSDVDRDDPKVHNTAPDPLGFANYDSRIRDLTPRSQMVPKGSTQFDAPFVYRGENLMFNIADYGHALMNDFRWAGGTIRHREFHTPAEFAELKEKVVINCTGYGARDLWKDNSITPVRGQIAWLIPQPEVDYGVFYNGVNILSRRDGIVVQTLAGGDMVGYGDVNETPYPAQAEASVATVAELYSRFRAPST
jgi:D-amino-acid oxidase